MRTSPNLVELGTIIRSLDGTPEAWRLPDAAQLAPVRGLLPVDPPTAVPYPGSIAPQRSVPSPLLRPPGNPLSSLTNFLITSAIAVLLAGYFIFANSHEEMNIATVPQLTIDTPPSVAFAQMPPSARIIVESKAEPEVKTTSLQPAMRLSQTPTETLIEARSPQVVPGSNSGHQASFGSSADAALDAQHTKPVIEKEPQAVAASVPASTCFPSASAVKQNQPGAWPSWTLRAPGHEGTRCWYAGARRITAPDHQRAKLPTAPAVGSPPPRNGE